MALWRWEFIENPQVSDDLPFFVIESDGEIRGAIGYVPLRLRVGERILSSGHPVNYFVGPRYKGLPALQLFRAMQNDCPVIFAGYFSGDSKRLLMKMGYIDLSQHVQRYYLPLHANTARLKTPAQRLLSTLLQLLRTTWGRILTFFFEHILTADVRLAVNNTLQKDFEEFVAVPPEQTLSVYKDAAYLQWRYACSPVLNCVFIHQYRNNRPAGLVVLHLDTAQRQAVILDIMVHPFRLLSSLRLLAAAVDYCRKKQTALLLTDILNKNLDKALRAHGFRRMRSEIGLIAYAHDKELMPILSDYRNWHFVIGDTDRH